MKKTLLCLALLGCQAFLNAQTTEGELIKRTSDTEKKAQDTTNVGWKRGGNFNFLFNQSAFNTEWRAGGVSNMSGTINLNYDINYKTKDLIWDNKFIAAYGLTKLKNADVQKSDDRLLFNSVVGKRAKGYWFYSAFLDFKSQMDSGFKKENYTNDNGTPLNLNDDYKATRDVKLSHFFSPAYLQMGPGMLWKKHDNFKFNIAPATARFVFVHPHFTQNGSSFGVEQGNSMRFEFGAGLQGYYKFKLMDNITWENILNLYTNYLDRPKNVDIDYQANLVMKINKHISTNLAFQAIYDDNAVGAFQIREVFGLGFNYGF